MEDRLADAAIRGVQVSETLLTTAQTSELLNVPVATLRWWRAQGGVGPKSFKMGARKVMYRRSDVIAWLDAQYAAAESDGAA